MPDQLKTAVVVDFVDRDPKRHSIRWDAVDKDSILSTVYLRKGDPVLDGASKIRVTIEVIA